MLLEVLVYIYIYCGTCGGSKYDRLSQSFVVQMEQKASSFRFRASDWHLHT